MDCIILNVLSLIVTRPKQPSPTIRYALDDKKALVLGELDRRAGLEQFCELLNSTVQSDLRDYLRRLVEAWQESGPNLLKMRAPVTGDWAYEILEKLFVVHWDPTCGGRANLYLAPLVTSPIPEIEPPPEIEAWVQFGIFTLNPHCEELAGPCARCGNYYVRKRRSQKVYCSRRCGNTATALVRTAEARKAEHKQKMIRAKALIREWNTLKGRSGLVWKVWLREHEPSITDKFVTRWVNMGDLKEPKAGSKP
jgi:hypothetical protein